MIRYHLSILLLYATLASGTGCQVLRIPSYRTDGTAVLDECYTGYDSNCQPGILPPAMPAPTWLTTWKKKQCIPQPPAYPRFHPLPTRPMFSPAKSQSVSSPSGMPTSGPPPAYGYWPPAIDGGPAAANSSLQEKSYPIPNTAPALNSESAVGQMLNNEGVLTPPGL